MNKKTQGILLIFVLVLLASCKPSDKYTGEWFAISDKGEETTINFSEDKTITVTNAEDGSEQSFDMKQTGMGIQNSVQYYHIEIDSKSYYVIFEDRKDEDNAVVIKQTNHASDYKDVVGDVIYTMNRESFPSHE